MSPPLPADFDATVIESTDTLAQAFIKLIRFSVLILRWYLSWFNSDGTLSDYFKERLCAACQGEGS